MKRHVLIGAAVAAVYSSCAFAQVLVNENFDDGAGASRWTVNVIKSSTNTGTNPTADFNFNYGNFNYEFTAFPNGATETRPIPAAPGGSTTIGLKVQNTPTGSGIDAGMNLAVLPNAVNVTGDFRIEGWVWQNYNGGPGNYVSSMGQVGSTEAIQIGLNRAGTTGVAGYLPAGATRSNGYGFMIATEGGGSADYAIYSNDTGDDGPNYAKRNAAWQGAVPTYRVDYAEPNTLSADAIDLSGNHVSPYWRDEVFTAAAGYEIPGAPAKKWTSFVMEQRGNIVTMSMNGKIMMTLFNTAAFSGTPQLGYIDINNGSIPSPADSQFSVFDNIKVTQLTAAPVNTITGDDYAQFNASGSLGTATLRGLHIAGTNNVALTGSVRLLGEGSAIYAPEGTNSIASVRFSSDTAIMVGNSAAGTIPATPPNGAKLTIAAVQFDAGAALTKTGMGTLELPNIRAESLSMVDGTLKLTGAGPGNASRIRGFNQQYLGSTATPGVSMFDIGKSVMQMDYDLKVLPSDPTITNSPLRYLIGTAAAPGPLILGLGTGTWDGTRGTKSSAAAAPAAGFAFRISEASVMGYTDGSTWGATGLPVDATAVLMGYTFAADTNLDQVVNFDDLLKVAQNYGTSYDVNTEGIKWYIGDSNGDGNINFDDLLLLAQQYGGTVSLIGADYDQTMQNNFASDWAAARSLVPEPASLSALALGGLVLRRRR